MRRGMIEHVLPDLLRERTASLHAQAERTSFVRDMIAGRVTPARYAPFARSLLEAVSYTHLTLPTSDLV